jgi:hypothetical protein
MAQAVRLQHAYDGRPVMVVSPSELLDVRGLRRLVAGLQVPWGVVTGRDRGAIGFALLKQRAAADLAPGPTVVADFVADVIEVRGDAALSAAWRVSERSPADTMIALVRRTGSFLLAHCHGDGAHGDFGTVVLCGLCHSAERVGDGRPGACRHVGGSQFRCKRALDGLRLPLRSGDLGATTVCLLTCNGFSVSGQFYPSDCSFVLSAAEGFPAAVLTTDRRLAFDRDAIALASDILSSGLPLGEATRLMNNALSMGDARERPYILFGDPMLVSQSSGARTTGCRATADATTGRAAGTLRAAQTGEVHRRVAQLETLIAVLAPRVSVHSHVTASCVRLVGNPSVEFDVAVEAHSRVLRSVGAHQGKGKEYSGGL